MAAMCPAASVAMGALGSLSSHPWVCLEMMEAAIPQDQATPGKAREKYLGKGGSLLGMACLL